MSLDLGAGRVSQAMGRCCLYKLEGQIDLPCMSCSYHVLIVAPFVLFFAQQV